MLIVGELINASRKAIATAIEAQDQNAIQQVARDQVEAGANYIDVNAGVFVRKESEYLEWLVKTVQSQWNVPLASTARTRRRLKPPWRSTKEPL